MTSLAITWIIIGALIAGASDSEAEVVSVWRIVAFAVLWPLLLIAAVGRVIGKRLGV